MEHAESSTSGQYQEVVSDAEARFDRGRKILGAVAAPVVFFVVLFNTHGLSPQGQSLAAVLAAVAVLWMTEALPLPVTAMVGAALCILLGVADAKVVLAPFANPIVFLFIGSFMLSRAMALHGLDRRLALGFLSWPWISAHPARVMAGYGLVTAFLSMWISNTATTAMMVPIGLGILQALHVARSSDGDNAQSAAAWPFAAGMMLMTAFAASIGGMGTPVGSPPNLIGIGLIRQHTGYDFTFFRWMIVALPICLTMLLLLIGLLYALHPPGRATLRSHELQVYLQGERQKLGPWTMGQINTLFALGVAFVLWVLPGVLSLFLPEPAVVPAAGTKAKSAQAVTAKSVESKTNDKAKEAESKGAVAKAPPSFLKTLNARVPEAVVAMIAMLLLFVLPLNLKGDFTLTWHEAVRIDWGTVLLFGGGLSLGELMFSTGVAEAIGNSVTAQTGVSSLWGLTAVSIAMAIVLSEATSNTAAANMVIPVVIALAVKAEINPVPPALGACLGTSFGFMLPVSTPPNAIAYGTGLVSIPKMARAGFLLDVLGFAVIWGSLRVLCPLLGMT